jgi:hypothetical protein
MAASLGQWAPLVMAAVLLPGLGFLAVCKPNIGLALAAARPTRAAIYGRAALLVASLAFDPHGRPSGSPNLRTMQGIRPPLFTVRGPRYSCSRCSAGVAKTATRAGHGGGAATSDVRDQLPLMLVARTRVESDGARRCSRTSAACCGSGRACA